MSKFAIWAMYTASKSLGEFEAETEDEAISLAEKGGDSFATLCHQCADELDLGDCYEFQAEKLT